MKTFEFALVVDRPPADHEWDQLADLAHDAGWTTPGDGSHAVAEFDRVAADLPNAIASAVSDLAIAGFNVTQVRPIELLADPDLDSRLSIPRGEAEHLITASPVAHPKPMHAAHDYLYRWDEIREWLDAHGVPHDYDDLIKAADIALGLRRGIDPRRVDLYEHLIKREFRRLRPWKMPEWMEAYRGHIGDHGGNRIEDLVESLDLEEHLARTNMPRFTIACMVQAQLRLLARLHADGCLPPAPNTPGTWNR